MKIKVKINLYTDGDYRYAYDAMTGASYVMECELEEDNHYEFEYLRSRDTYTLSAVFDDEIDVTDFLGRVFCNIRVGYRHYYVTRLLYDMFEDAIRKLHNNYGENYCCEIYGNYEETCIEVEFIEEDSDSKESPMNVYEQVKNMTMDEFRNFCFTLYNKGWNDGSNHVSDECWIYSRYPESEVLNPFDDEEQN